MKNKRLYVLLLVLCVLSVVAHYRFSHPDKIFASKAERAFKKNNIEEAQVYLEKAFDAGSKDYDLREMYLNSLINSPFDEKNQKRLIKFLEYSVDDDLTLKAEYFLRDFKSEVNKKYPDNYITQAAYNQQILRWSNIPITYNFVNPADAPEHFIKEIENAFTKWEVATEHQILFMEDKNNPNIIIDFKTANPADSNYKKYVVAYTTPELNLNNLKHSLIHFYLRDPNEVFYSPNQVYNTALHEIVHALGVMGHSSDKNDVMYSTKNPRIIIEDLRYELTDADINTVKLLYKIKPDITNVPEPQGEYTPFIVLGGEETISTAKMKEAISYVKKAPKLAGGYMDLAESLVAKQDYDGAKKYLKKALTLADTEDVKGMIYFNIAVVEYYLENYDNAQKYLVASMKINDAADAHYLLAEIYSKQGAFSKAAQEYRSLLNSYPNNIEYVIGLTNLYIKGHKYLSARKVLETYFKSHPQERNNKRFEPYGIIKMFL